MAFNIRKVNLNNSSRKGSYYRFVSEGFETYIKDKGQNPNEATQTGLLRLQRAISRKKARKPYKNIKVHYKIKYDSSGHSFEMVESYVQTKVPRLWTNEEIREFTDNLIEEAIAQEFSPSLSGYTDPDLIKGIEEIESSDQKIVINYRHRKSARYTRYERSLGDLLSYKEEKVSFFKRVRK